MAKGKKEIKITHPMNLSVTAVLSKLGTANAALAIHPSYQGELPSMVATLTELKEVELNLRDTHHAVLNGNRTLVPQRDAYKAKADEDLYHFCHFVQMLGRKDPAALLNTGLDTVRSTVAAGSTAPTAIPANFRLSHGFHSGTMYGKVNRMPGVLSYEMYINEGDPTVEEHWKYYNVFGSSSKMEITGREPGRLYHARVRGINSHGASPWSSPTTLRAI